MFLWSSKSSPFLCINKDNELICKIKIEKEGFYFSSMKIEKNISSLNLDFSGNYLKAEKIIDLI